MSRAQRVFWFDVRRLKFVIDTVQLLPLPGACRVKNPMRARAIVRLNAVELAMCP
jgi:hypothetical protein